MTDAPDFSRVRLRAASLHRSFTHWRLKVELTPDVRDWFLAYFRLEDAIHAAAAVGYHCTRLLAWQQAAAPVLDGLAASRGRALKPGDVLEMTGVRDATAEGDFLFHDALWWARAFDDRMFTARRQKWQTPCLLELLPEQVRSRIEPWAADIRPWLLEARRLGNFSIHSESLNQQAPLVRRTETGWVLPIPDRPTKELNAYTNFNYAEARDAATHAVGLARALERFLGALLDEIEKEERDRGGPVSDR